MTFRWILAGGLVACGSSNSGVPDGGIHLIDADGGSGAQAMTKTIHGIGTRHDVTDGGIVDTPIDFRTGYQAFAGATPVGFRGSQNGTFELDVPPDATSWTIELVQGNQHAFYVSSADPVDLSTVGSGRSGGTYATGPTSITLNATGLTPWQSGDALQLYTSNTGTFGTLPDGNASPGATTVATTFDWNNYILGPLPDAAKGDVTRLLQLEQLAAGVYTLVATATASLTVTSGQPVTASFTFAPVARTRSLAVHWQRSQFAALAGQLGTGATASYHALDIASVPHFATAGFSGIAPELAIYAPSGDSDIDYTFTYGDPFDTGDEVLEIAHGWAVPLAIGNETPSHVSVAYLDREPLAAVTGAIVPVITPVRDVTIAGQDISTGTAAHVGLAPEISWTAPATGNANTYVVTVYRLVAETSGTAIERVADVTVAGTSLVLPPNLLASGNTYALEVTARTQPQLAEFPIPSALVGTVTKTFTPD